MPLHKPIEEDGKLFKALRKALSPSVPDDAAALEALARFELAEKRIAEVRKEVRSAVRPKQGRFRL